MDEVARLLTLLALLGGALTLMGSVLVWFLDETRRIRRTLTQALGVPPQPVLIARGRGVGIGFDLKSERVVVVWDKGVWRLDYRLDELMGVELIVDHQVVARAFRNEARRPLDRLSDPEAQVQLRFVFDDPSHPDFLMELWVPEDEQIRGRLRAYEVLQEANRWVARMEALLRRPVASRQTVAAPVTLARRRASPPVIDERSGDADFDVEDEDDPEDGSCAIT